MAADTLWWLARRYAKKHGHRVNYAGAEGLAPF